MSANDYSVVILAGGIGKRMNSNILKPLIKLRGKPMIEYVVETFKFAGVNQIIVVSHPNAVREISKIPGVTKVVVQHEPLGTFHALKTAINDVTTKYTFVTPADKPLLSSDNIRKVIELDSQAIYGYESQAVKAVLVLDLNDRNRIVKIAEDKEDILAHINERFRTGGVYCFETEYIKRLECDIQITKKNKNNEYYLTDVIPFLETKPLLFPIQKKSVANINTAQELNEISELFGCDEESEGPTPSSLGYPSVDEGCRRGPKGIKEPIRIRARLNLMGRHIDHQGGFTNVILLDKHISCKIYKRADIYERHILETKYGSYYLDLSSNGTLNTLPLDGFKYLAAPILYLKTMGYEVMPCKIAVEGDIPEGCGLSSSSAIIVAVMKALIDLNLVSNDISGYDLVSLCGEAEKLVGTNGGYGDHAAMILGNKDGVTKIITHGDIKVYDQVSLPIDLGILVINSGETAKKGFECKAIFNDKVNCYKEGLKVCQRLFGIHSLSDVLPEMLESIDDLAEPMVEVRKVMLYGINEMERAKSFVNVLRSGNLEEIGRMVKASQDDERNLYGCSTVKIEQMIAKIGKVEGVLGSQICGAGLGGCFMVFYDKKYSLLNALKEYEVICSV